MQQINGIYFSSDSLAGRGVFTSFPLEKGDVIELCPVIVIPESQIEILNQIVLYDYYFLWEHGTAAIALGYGSLYNHSYTPNAEYIMDYEAQQLIIKAITSIPAGAEITFNYNGDPDNREKVWFPVR